MRTKAMVLMVLPILILTSFLGSAVCEDDERKVLSRSYVGLGVEVYASDQCYPGENTTVRVRMAALEDVKNASATLFLWGSKSAGENPWSTSFTAFDLTDFPNGTIKEEARNITIPLDIDPGLTYGILSLDWSIYQTASWEHQWDKASFRTTYVADKDYEDLQVAYQSAVNDLQNTSVLMYVFLVTTVILTASTIYVAIRRLKRRP